MTHPTPDDAPATEKAEPTKRLTFSDRWLLTQCETILSNMSMERQGFWSRLFKGRWMISAEPLRNDAINLLPHITLALDRKDANA
jgi:hypothetical protein